MNVFRIVHQVMLHWITNASYVIQRIAWSVQNKIYIIASIVLKTIHKLKDNVLKILILKSQQLRIPPIHKDFLKMLI